MPFSIRLNQANYKPLIIKDLQKEQSVMIYHYKTRVAPCLLYSTITAPPCG